MKINTLIYTPYVQNNDFGYQPKYLGKTSNYRPVQEVPTMETAVEPEVQQVQEEPKPIVPEVAPIQGPTPSKFSSVNEFKKVMVSVYEQALKARGFDPAFAKPLAAQDALESSWGRKPSGKYNFGGIKGKGTIKTTKEFINGRYITINDSFRDFKDIYEYANFKIDLLNKPRYNVFAHPVNEFAFWVKKGGYATAPTYTQILNNVIKKFKPGGLITYTPFIGGNDLNSTSFTDNRISKTSRSNTSDFKVTNELESFVQEEVPQELPVALPVETPQFQFKQFVPKRGLEGRYAQFANIYTSAGLPQNELGFWANIAQDESGFTPGIVGRNDKYGVEALGYFQMLTKYNNKPMNIAGTYSGVDSQTFLSNPVIQLKAAQNMKNHIMNMFSAKDLEVARAKGYTDSALVAGAWAGGVGGVRKWLHYGKNSVDVNVKDGNNAKRKWECSVAGRMEALNGYFKKGGVLKFATGGGFEKYVEDNRDHINNIYSRITGWGVGDVGYKDTLMTYRRNAPSQLFASTKDDKTAFSEKHFDNVRRYISDKVASEKLTNDVLYDIFLDFDKHNIKSLNFNQRQDLIDRIISTSKKPYLSSLSKHEIFYALEGLYGSSSVKKGMYGMKVEQPNTDLFTMSEYHGATPSWDDLYNFTASYETFNPNIYWLKDDKGNRQELIGHGIALSRVDPETANRWRTNGITEEESLEWMRNEYKHLDDHFSNTIKNYKYLPMELRVPILDAAYNTSGTNFFTNSENLRGHVENGDHYTTIAAELDHSMNHSADKDNKDIGSWLAVRSAARRAMALGEYNYNWQYKDKYGRHILPGQSGPQDWKFSPYYNKYKNIKTEYADYFR